MDPITIIVAALAAGATAGLTGVAEESIKDAYAGIKQWIQDRYADVSLKNLEKDPKSQNRQGVLAEELQEAGAGEDQELLSKVQALNEALAKSEAGRRAAQAVGVDLDDLIVEGDAVIRNVRSTGTGVRIKGSEFDSSLTIDGIEAGGSTKSSVSNPQ